MNVKYLCLFQHNEIKDAANNTVSNTNAPPPTLTASHQQQRSVTNTITPTPTQTLRHQNQHSVTNTKSSTTSLQHPRSITNTIAASPTLCHQSSEGFIEIS
ncbi:hypothetical protein fugu_011954 [Takifugu bimaculatus]|uniref:Uncharacterized protein n=1 Tax=Takifugu bimaculatus TaxID=433685 RepID=A0A4Z2C954_9TELE|nr:hypothetical protein fugu_011954 [Takifugu bimaculatus]